MNELTLKDYQILEDKFLLDFKNYYGIEDIKKVINCKNKLFGNNYPLEFLYFLSRTKVLVRYSLLLLNLDKQLYYLDPLISRQGMPTMAVTYGAILNPYIFKRNPDKTAQAWINIQKDWYKYAKAKQLF